MNINGQEYSWGDITVIHQGKSTPMIGVTAIEYGEKQEKENVYGRGFEPVATSQGKIEAEGSLTILTSEFIALVEGIVGKKSPLWIPPFLITVSYIPEGGKMITDKLFACRYTEWKKAWKTGDMHSEITMPMMIGSIKLNQ